MIQTITVEGPKHSHPAKEIYAKVGEIMRDLGYGVNLIDRLSGDPDIHEREVGLTLQLSETVCDFIRAGMFPFSLERNLDGFFGESEGSANVTTLRMKRDMNLDEVLSLLETTGQLEESLGLIEQMSSHDDPPSETILAYAIAQYAKGWIAEELIHQHKGMSKGSVSNDEGGIDFYWNGEEIQLGSITRFNSNRTKIKGSERRHLLYQWTHDGEIVFGDPKDIIEKNKEIAKDAGLSSTLTQRSHGGLKINEIVGRSFRYLWW